MGRRVHKLDGHVPFPEVLDLSPYLCARGAPAKTFAEWRAAEGARAPTARTGECGGARLELYGVVEHQGTFAGGHYVAYVRNGGCWYRMNDSIVEP
eukprot:3375012-Prymnesium_polylepis.1